MTAIVWILEIHGQSSDAIVQSRPRLNAPRMKTARNLAPNFDADRRDSDRCRLGQCPASCLWIGQALRPTCSLLRAARGGDPETGQVGPGMTP